MKHTEVPHELDNREVYQLEHGDKIIYAAVRKYINKDTRECFPAIRTIAKMLQCTPGKVQAALTRLVNAGFIEKSNDGHKNHYKFPVTEFDKQFEMFTDAFLELDIPLNIKEYYMDIQQYLYGKDTGVGRCSFSNAKLARCTGWTVASVKKYNTYLIEHGFLEEETTNKTDEAGFPMIQKNFDLTSLQQAELWARAVTQQVIQNTSDIEDMKRELAELREWKKRKEREDALERNRVASRTYNL